MSKNQKKTVELSVETVDNSQKVGVQGETMSKDQKKTVELSVETVDNWSKTLSYIMTTLDFWIKDKKWPINLCYDGLCEISNQMFDIIQKNVSPSHIIDKWNTLSLNERGRRPDTPT